MSAVEHPKAKPFLDRARAAGLRVVQAEGSTVWFISRGSLAEGTYVYLFVLDGPRGGNLRAYVVQRGRKDKRLTKPQIGSWIMVLGRV